MPEQLKPCPFCGGQPTLRGNIYDSGEYLASINCPCINGDVAESYFLRSGETQKQATNKSIAAWNTRAESLPRRPDYNDVDCAGCPARRHGYLTWTSEPPNAPGWYWVRRTAADDFPIIKHVAQRDATAALLKREWAGPIPAPLEPEGE